MIETKLKREQRGAVNVNPILIVALVGIAAVVGAAWYFKWGPFSRGGVGIDIGYILDDGSYVLASTDRMVFYFNPTQPLAWYSDSGLTHRIAGVYGQLSVKAVITGIDATTATISWTGSSTTGAVSNSGSKNIDIGGWVSIPESRLEARGFWYAGSYTDVDMTFNVTATAGTPSMSASTTASASLRIYWGANSLSIEASVDEGTFDFTR